MQKSTAALAAVVALAALGGLVFWALQDDTPADVPDTPDTTEPTVETAPLTAVERQHRSMTVFPFHQFQHEIDELRAVRTKRDDGNDWKADEHEYNLRIVNHKVRCQMEDVTVQEVVDFLKAEYEKAGLVITDFGKPIPDLKVTIMRVEADAFEIIADLQKQTQLLVTYAATEFGTVIGTEGTIQEWYMHTNQRRAQEHARAELDDPILDAKFTIDVEDAHVGAVLEKMNADTGVEVICGPKIWNRQRKVTMKYPDSITLRQGLKVLAAKMGGFIRVKDERVYLIRL